MSYQNMNAQQQQTDDRVDQYAPGAPLQMTARSEGPSTGRSIASSARLAVHPAMALLFDMADRRQVGWLTVTDLQVGAVRMISVMVDLQGSRTLSNT